MVSSHVVRDGSQGVEEGRLQTSFHYDEIRMDLGGGDKKIKMKYMEAITVRVLAPIKPHLTFEIYRIPPLAFRWRKAGFSFFPAFCQIIDCFLFFFSP